MKHFYLLVFLLLNLVGWGQCEVYITPGSATIIDHDPGISFVFEVQNDSDTPYFGGDLYLDWNLSGGNTGPIWEFNFGVFAILPGESKYVSTPSFDIPLPENVPGNWSPYSGWSGDEYNLRITLDENVNFNDSDCYQWMLDGDGGYWNEPLSDGCNNPNGDNFCDDQCNLEVLDFNLETAELTILPNSTYCPNLGSPIWQSQYPYDNPYVFGFQLNFNWGIGQLDVSIGSQQIYESSDPIVIDLGTVLSNSIAYQNMLESIENDEFCEFTLTLYNINNFGQSIWEANDNQIIELINLCPQPLVDIALDTILYDIGCEWVFGSPDPVPYWIPTFYLTNNGEVPITEFCIVEDVIGTLAGDDTICFNNLNIIPGETYELEWPNMYEWGVLSVRVIDVNGEGENFWDDFGLDDNIEDNMYVQIINYNDECVPTEIEGCTDETANNYNPIATINDGSCTYDVLGCTDISANNFNPLANIDDGSCTYDVFGCTDANANNFNPFANVDDNSCEYDVFGCTDAFASNYNPLATVEDGSCVLYLAGCTDEEALNYNPQAIIDDGSCVVACLLFIPNTFTPNNDGLNDVWYVEMIDPSCWLDWHAAIYNRWGGLVWESNTPDDVWSGSNYGGNYYIADGIYVYTVRGIGYNPLNTFEKSGHITIFR